jgi:enoyl-CoA hydratase/carnithine racemase
LVRGEGADFCLGGDVRDWPGMPLNKLRPKIEVFAEALEQLRRLPIPTIAAVQGGCMGGGFELALSCDLIVAAKSARFGFPEARLGILTLQGGMMLIAERVGRAKAAEMVFLSQPVAEKAELAQAVAAIEFLKNKAGVSSSNQAITNLRTALIAFQRDPVAELASSAIETGGPK